MQKQYEETLKETQKEEEHTEALKETQKEKEHTEVNQIDQLQIFGHADQGYSLQPQSPINIKQPQQTHKGGRQRKSLNLTADPKQIGERKSFQISKSENLMIKLFSSKTLFSLLPQINKCQSKERKIYKNKQNRDEAIFTSISTSEINTQDLDQIEMEAFLTIFEEENLLYEAFRRLIFQNRKIFIWNLSSYQGFSQNKINFKIFLKKYDILTIEMSENRLILIDNRKDQQKYNVYTLNAQELRHFADDSLKPLDHITIDLQKLKTLSKIDQQKYQIILKEIKDLTSKEVEKKYLFQNMDAKLFMKFLKEDSFINTLTEIIKQQCQYLIDFNEVDQKQLFYIEQQHNKSYFYSCKVNYDSQFTQNGIKQNVNATMQSPIVSLIRSANRQLRKSNLYALNGLWKYNLAGIINSCLKDWSIYSPFLEQELITFTLLAQCKFLRFNFNDDAIFIYQTVYEGMTDLVNKLHSFFKSNYNQISLRQKISSIHKQEGKNSNNKQLQITRTGLEMEDDSMSQKILDFYIQQKQQFKKTNILTVGLQNNKKQSVRQFKQEKIIFFGQLSEFRDIFSMLTYKNPRENDNYFKNIKTERLPQMGCLGCSQFFIYGRNILDETVNSTPLRVFPSVQKMKNFKMQIKDQICSMLNSGGGIILFGGIRQDQNVKIQGIKLSQKDKQELQQRLISYMEVFQPKIQARNSIKISFVPIVANRLEINGISGCLTVYLGEEAFLKPKQLFRPLNYLQGIYILRIKVCPVNEISLYYWSKASHLQLRQEYKKYVCTSRKGTEKSIIKMKNVAREIKKKMKIHYIQSNISKEERILMMKPYSFFNHQCKAPLYPTKKN